MPITKFQRELLLLIRAHRNPNSFIAGGVAIHRSDTSSRYSNDVDFFHDSELAVLESARSDREVLTKAGYAIKVLIEQPSFIRVVVSKGTESLKLEWARDTAFRFFPAIEDAELGYRLHDIDLAVNKCLTLANRNEVRDIIDLIQLHKDTISVTGACWAACGKDPGFTPALLLDCMRRHSIIRNEQLEAESLTKKVIATELKKDWLTILDNTAQEIESLPAADLGCLFLDRQGLPIRSVDLAALNNSKKHYGTIGGSWPRFID